MDTVHCAHWVWDKTKTKFSRFWFQRYCFAVIYAKLLLLVTYLVSLG